MGKMLTGSLPAYIEVYNSLYSDIMNNVYLEGEQLPVKMRFQKNTESAGTRSARRLPFSAKTGW